MLHHSVQSSFPEISEYFTIVLCILILKYHCQALLIFIGLCCARDEVYWLLRHNDNPPQQKSKGKTAEDLVDRQLPELLFHMEELRGKILFYILTPFCLPYRLQMVITCLVMLLNSVLVWELCVYSLMLIT
jgi:hypothetical protein